MWPHFGMVYLHSYLYLENISRITFCCYTQIAFLQIGSQFTKFSYQRCNSFPYIRRHMCNCSHSHHPHKLLHFGKVYQYNHLYLKLKILEINDWSYFLILNIFVLRLWNWQSTLTNTAILSRISDDTGAIVVVYAIHTSSSILAWSKSTVIDVWNNDSRNK